MGTFEYVVGVGKGEKGEGGGGRRKGWVWGVVWRVTVY